VIKLFQPSKNDPSILMFMHVECSVC